MLAILGAIYGNLSKQAKMIKELKIGKVFKTAILNNYCFIEDQSTFRLFNQSILQLQIKRAVLFTLCELEKYRIKDALMKTLPSHQTGNLQTYLERIFPRFQEKQVWVKNDTIVLLNDFCLNMKKVSIFTLNLHLFDEDQHFLSICLNFFLLR